MRKLWGLAVLFVCALSGTASAQPMDPPYDPAVDIQLFEYSVGPKSFFSVDDGGVANAKQLSADAMITFITDPFVIYNVDETNDEITTTRTAVVESLLAAELSGAYGISNKLQVGAALPLILSMSGDGLNTATAGPGMESLQSTGLGDLRIEAKYLLLEKPNLRVAGIGGITVPTSVGSGGGDYLGDDLPTGRGRAAVQWIDRGGKLTVGANAGIILRKPRTLYSSKVGQQITYSVGAAFRFNERFAAVGETFGRSGFSMDVDSSPLEIAAGLRLRATPAISVVLGGGAGLVQGIGSPGVRAFIAVGWAPDYRDTDNDGITNIKDRCVLVPEDKDGFEDTDGCPEHDNDGDLRPDTEDKCPDQKEDLDGFDDDDGCPELDNDKDTLNDMDDKCPNDAEDGKPPHAKDGCPANKRDSDTDGVMDACDVCPTEEEDEDEFEDFDGCAEADNDKDGIADADDKCPVCAEDMDGEEDEDGCPDIPAADPRIAKLVDGRVVFGRDPSFDKKGALTPEGKKIVAHLAGLMNEHIEVTAWTLAVGGKTKAIADKMGADLKATLSGLGVREDTLTVLTTAGTTKVAVLARETRELTEEEQNAGFTCPAEYQMAPREKPADFCAAGSPTPLPATPAPAPEPEPIVMEPPAPDPVPAPPVPAGPVDSDGDGLLDDVDMCDAEAGPPEAKGCPDTDRDGDTVVDRLDNCPDVKGKPANAGCADKQLAVISGDKIEIKQQVFFKKGKATIEKKSFKLLDNVAKVIVAHPEVTMVVVEGHTDDVGDDASNLTLSQARADAVVTYLTGKAVAADRLKGIGYGETRPIADNKRSKGREKNRRVELKVSISAGTPAGPVP
jgi:OmpA-OmpF porin, OOP family